MNQQEHKALAEKWLFEVAKIEAFIEERMAEDGGFDSRSAAMLEEAIHRNISKALVHATLATVPDVKENDQHGQ